MFTKEDAEKIKEEHNLTFSIDDILEGLNVELEHKDITGGDLEETAKIVMAHLKEKSDYYKLLKEYVEDLDVLDEYTIGTIREWKGGKYKKMGNGKWEQVIGGKLPLHLQQLANKMDKKDFKIETIDPFESKSNNEEEVHYTLKNETMEQAIERYVGYQIENGLVKLEEDKYGWKASFVIGEDMKKIRAFSKQKVLNEVYELIYPNTRISDNVIIYDTVSIHNKKATIMRDGYYKYLAREVDRNAVYPMDIVTVYRPAEEVRKAYTKFKDELKKLPVIANHPEQDLDLTRDESYQDGEGIKPELKIVNGETLLNCELSNMKGKVKEFYDKGIKEISCGWHGEYEKVEGKDYQYIQKFKDFNHIAVLERGRCGNTCSIKDGEQEMFKDIDINDEYTIGTIREWQGGKFKKLGNGEWEKVNEEKKDNKEEVYEVSKEILKEIQNSYKKEYPSMSQEIILKNTEAIFKGLNDNKYLSNYLHEGNKVARNIIANLLGLNWGKDVTQTKIKNSKETIMQQILKNKGIILDNEIEKGVEDMTKEELEQLVEQKVNDKVSEVLDAKEKEMQEKKETQEEEKKEEHEKAETPEEEKKEEETKKGEFKGTEEEIEDAYLNSEEDEDDLEKAKGKLKKFKDCYGKMKAVKKEVVKDEDAIAIYDQKISDAKIAIRDAFVKNMSDILPVIENGIFTVKDSIGKTPCEIKAMTIKKVLDKDVSIDDMAIVNALFDVALKSYVNPAWNKKVNDSGLVGIEAIREESRKQFEKVAKGEKLGGE